jgi:hypothetical protein
VAVADLGWLPEPEAVQAAKAVLPVPPRVDQVRPDQVRVDQMAGRLLVPEDQAHPMVEAAAAAPLQVQQIRVQPVEGHPLAVTDPVAVLAPGPSAGKAAPQVPPPVDQAAVAQMEVRQVATTVPAQAPAVAPLVAPGLLAATVAPGLTEPAAPQAAAAPQEAARAQTVEVRAPEAPRAPAAVVHPAAPVASRELHMTAASGITERIPEPEPA